jgi:hypothetical protein
VARLSFSVTTLFCRSPKCLTTKYEHPKCLNENVESGINVP